MDKISKEDLIKAIEFVKDNGIPNNRKSFKYDLLYEGEKYPPLYIVSLANEFATGEEIPPNTLGGGPSSEAFELLYKFGFKVVEKGSEWNKEAGYQEQEAFLKEWPVERVRNMTLEEYTNLDRETSFIYWLEKKTENTGSIWGGSAFKFGIYKRRNTEGLDESNQYSTDGVYAWYSKYGNTKEEAFSQIKSFIEIIVSASIEKNLSLIDPIDWGNSIKWKIAFLYNTENIIPIFKTEVLLRASESTGLEDPKNQPVSSLQKHMLSQKKEDMLTLEYANQIWSQYNLDNFYYIIDKFLKQAQTSSLKKSGYKKVYKDLQVKVSFGVGIQARIPWIALLKEPNTVTNGIYPVYLYYKEVDCLILAYGVSETTNSENHWLGLPEYQRIDEWYIEEFGAKPARYGDSYIKAVYNLDEDISPELIQKDLDEILDIYSKQDSTTADLVEEPEIEYGKDKIQYWLYAPGEDAYKWEEFYENGIMGLGWDRLGDLTQYQSKNEIKQALFENYGGKGSKKNDVNANNDFVNNINIGDFIIAKKGRRKLLGYGIVRSKYKFDASKNEYKSIRSVDWKLKGDWIVDFSLVLKTLTDITKYTSNDAPYNTFYDKLLGIMGVNENTTNHNSMNYPLNTIFYGPPGTGKTYRTVLRAAEIIKNRKIDSYDEALKIFQENLHGQIEFITFHQNYSYEDFIQGLRPDTENEKELTFERKDGVFKIIADKALKNIIESEHSPVAKKTFEETFNQFVNPLIEGEVEEIEVKMKKVSYYITEITNKSIEFRKTSGGTEHTLSISTLRKMYDAESILDMQGLASYYTPLLDKLLKIGKDSSGKKESIQRKNYVIIIDEINRANISRVFGELITLIEPDKRSNGKIPMEAKLPSGDTFIVPSNLFIIGTMNTADKSIALLDIALRRRFEFESMYPKYEIEDQEIYDVEILEKINNHIIKSKGHDFQIGHAYFMGDNKDLVQRMNKKVIPLLLEYYMNDEKEVKEILISAGLIMEEKSWPLKISGKK